MKRIILLGATGNIGQQVLEVLKKTKKYKLIAFSIGDTKDVFNKIKNILKDNLYVKAICIRNRKNINKLRYLFSNIVFFHNNQGLINLIKFVKTDVVFNALVGFVGLGPLIFALKKKINVILANKESLIVGGEIIRKILKKYKSKIFPVDSEHSGIYRCLKKIKNKKNEIKEIFITASGGAFRNLKREELKNVTPNQALLHPTWKMGNKITIDSATMINKGFEIIEAYYLFNFPISKIKILMHKESCVHAILHLKNNKYVCDVSKPNMINPICFALEINNSLKNIKIVNSLNKLNYNFNNFDIKRYPIIKYVLQAIKKKGIMPCVINAANEIAVDAFLKQQISFLDIEKIVKLSMKKFNNIKKINLKLLIKIDKKVRKWTRKVINNL